MTSNSSQDWQVFISCKVSDENDEKTRDWYIAKELYELLQENHIRVFMSSFSIEELGESAYKEVIEEALDKARIMVVVGTTKGNLNSKWVKYEWDSFHNEIISGRKLNGQILTMTDELANSDLPYALRYNQSYKTSEKVRLLNFIKRKLESFDFRQSITVEEIEEEKTEETLRDTSQEPPEEKTEEIEEVGSDRVEKADENLETDDRSNETSIDVPGYESEEASADTGSEKTKEETEEEKAEETLHNIAREELEEKTEEIEEVGSDRIEKADENLETDDRSNETSIDVPGHEPEEASADTSSEETKEETEEEKADETLRDIPQEALEESEEIEDRTEEYEHLEIDDRSNETSIDLPEHKPEESSADTSSEEMKEEIEEEKAEETLRDTPQEALEESEEIEDRTEENENLETGDKSNETSIDVPEHKPEEASTDTSSEEVKEEIEEEKAEETLQQEAPEDKTDHHEKPVKKRRIAIPLFIFFTVLVTIAIAVMSLQDHPLGSSSKENSKPEITLTSPIDGFTGIHPDLITLKWIGKDSDGDEISYKVYFGETGNPGYVSTTHSNQLTITKKDWGKKYYWRVQASDNHGGTTTSQVYSFTTKENKAPIMQPNPSPSHEAMNQPTTITLSWECSDPEGDTVTYDVYFGTSTDLKTPVTSNQSSRTLTRSNLSQGTTYYWKVVAKDSKGATTEGPIWRFTTISNEAPKAPSNPSPTNDSFNQPLALSLSWDCDDSDGDSITYDVYFGTGTNPSTKVSSNQTDNKLNRSNLSRGTTYYWKVVAKDSKGATTEGPIWRFTTISNEAPKAPSNPSPTNDSFNQPLALSLSWDCDDSDGDSITYDVYFGTGTNPSTKVSSNQTDNKLNRSNLSRGTTYYWKVVAKDSKGGTTESPVWKFTTRSNEPPKPPSNPSPTNDSFNQPLALSLSWDCDDSDGDSVTYDVYFGTNSDLRVKESIGNSAKSINKSGLSYNTTYYWKVVAKDSKGATTEGPIWRFTTSKVPERMVLVEKGSFIMGDSSGLGFDRERPAHEVTIDYEFAIGKCEITFDEYDVFCRDSNRESPYDEGWGRGRRPVINVTWYDAIAYCNWLSELESLPKAYDENGRLLDMSGRVTDDPSKVLGYRLPTEAEWEYAAKGGASISHYRYSGGDEVGKVAWYYSNSFGKTQEVGRKIFNELGLFDMSGNVWEWCSDSYRDDFYSLSTGKNPYNNEVSSFRVSRGGGFSDSEIYLRVESRFYYNVLTAAKDLGFRVCRTLF